MKRFIEGGIFDLGSTLLNTKPLILRSFIYAFEENGLQPPEEQDILNVVGFKLDSCFRRLTHNRKLDPTSLIAAFRESQKNHANLITLAPYTKSLLYFMNREELPVVLLSTRSLQATRDLLEATGINSMFHAVLPIENPKAHKNFAASIMRATAQIGVDGFHTVMLADTKDEIWSARLARCRKIAATSAGIDGKNVSDAQPNYVIENNGKLISIIENLQRGRKNHS